MFFGFFTFLVVVLRVFADFLTKGFLVVAFFDSSFIFLTFGGGIFSWSSLSSEVSFRLLPRLGFTSSTDRSSSSIEKYQNLNDECLYF